MDTGWIIQGNGYENVKDNECMKWFNCIPFIYDGDIRAIKIKTWIIREE
jgi:hypothetical protein